MNRARVFLLIGGELDQLKVDVIQPEGVNMTADGLFYLPSHLPDHTVILNIYETLDVVNEAGEELFTFKIATFIRPHK
jgi:hypothetical protein